jgi:hypothetical protein
MAAIAREGFEGDSEEWRCQDALRSARFLLLQHMLQSNVAVGRNQWPTTLPLPLPAA